MKDMKNLKENIQTKIIIIAKEALISSKRPASILALP